MKVLAGRREKILFFRDKGRTFFLKLDPNQRLRVKMTGKEIITEGRSKVRPAIAQETCGRWMRVCLREDGLWR